MKKKDSLICFALLFALFILTGCASMANRYMTSRYDEPTDIDTSMEAIDYLFSNICPYIDLDTAEEIIGLVNNSLEYQRLYAYRNGDSVIITNYVSNLKAEIRRNSISFGLSVDIDNYSGNDRIKKLVFMIDEKEIGFVNIGNDDIAVSTKYSDISQSYLRYGHHDIKLSESWRNEFCSLGNGERHKVYFIWEASGDSKWYLEVMPPNHLNDAFLRATYLIDKAMKSYSEIISQLRSSEGMEMEKALLSAIENGQILVRNNPNGLSLLGDNIILENRNNAWQMFIMVEVLSSYIEYAAIHVDSIPIWIPEFPQFVSGNSFVYPLNDNSILSYFKNNQKCFIEFYDSNYSIVDSKSIITSKDKLLVDAFFRLAR